MTVVWELTGLTFGFPGCTLAADLNLVIHAGSRIAIAGPNGAGKTTFLHLLAGMHREYRGTIRFLGQLLRELPQAELAKQRSLLAQASPVDIPLDVFELAALGLAPHTGGAFPGPAQHRRIRAVLEQVGLSGLEHVPVARLSGGEFRRALLARALLQSSEVLLLDEPTAAFDPAQILHFHDLLRGFGEKATVVMVTHLLDSLFEFSHLLLFGHGRWVYGPVESVLREHGEDFFQVGLDFPETSNGQKMVRARRKDPAGGMA